MSSRALEIPDAAVLAAALPKSVVVPEPELRRLGDLGVGQACIVRRLHLTRPLARRLFEMGLLPGTLVRIERVAPLGDPLELRLRHYSLSIRRQEALQIEVDLLAG